jgi:DNA-binding GntR family transcriptional regulator
MLERSGFVNRQRRPRTTVSRPKVVRALSALSLRGGLKRQGLKLQTRLLRYQRAVVPPKFVQAVSDCPPAPRSGRCDRCVSLTIRVIGYDRRYLPPSVAAASILRS